jgi:hypothetical protein
MKRRNFLALATGASLAIPATALALRSDPDPQPTDAEFFTEDMFLVDGKPVEKPTALNYVFAIIDSASATGTVYFGRSISMGGYALTILDWDYQQTQQRSLNDIRLRLEHLEDLGRECRAIRGSGGAFIENKASGAILLQQIANEWLVHPIDSKLAALSVNERMVYALPHIASGSVKITREAHEKGIRRLMSLRDCISYGVCAALNGTAI